MKKKIKRPWNPFWLIFISIFFSFILAGLVAAFNYGRMNKPELKKKTIKYTLLGFSVLCIFILSLHNFIPDLPHIRGLGTFINIVVGVLLENHQRKYYIEWKLNNEFKQKV